MKKLRSLILVIFLALPLSASFGQVGISINFAPPPLIVETQPPAPFDGYIWTPGYWAWGVSNYYWVPGVWVPPPTIGLLWTPPWWGWNNGVYVFNEGYWGPTVGFYGGINYGFGYFGTGYAGGYWENNVFRYNTAVTHVDTTVIHNTYVDKTVINKEVNRSHTSFNGPNGVKAQPTAEQKAAAEKKVPPTSQQLARQEAASKDPKLQASAKNKGKLSSDAIKSFDQTHPTGKGAEGAGAAATGAGAGTGKPEHKAATERAGVGAGAKTGAEHVNKHATENVHGNKQNLGAKHTTSHPGKPPGYGGSVHGQPRMMQGPRNPQMGAYHPQGEHGGANRGHPGGQPQGKKRQGKPE